MSIHKLLLIVAVVLAACGCEMKPETAPTNATAEQVWSVWNGNDCFWVGKTQDGQDMMVRISNHQGQWSAMADRGSRHFFPRDVSASDQEVKFTISNSVEAGVGGLGEVLVEMAADAAVSGATAKTQTVSLRLQDDRQSATVWIWDPLQNQWVSQGITLTRSIITSS